ncbi:hydrogen gas-evolving membrane-bound hydrogenase subunit E [Methanolobus chelungpuianus]
MAAILPAAERVLKNRVGWYAAAVALICLLLVAQALPAVVNGETVTGSFPWIPSLQVELSFYGDGLSVMFGLIVSGIGILIMSYSNEYMSKREDLSRYYRYLLMFMGSMLGMVFSSNAIQLFVFWELTSITSFMLIGYWRNRPMSVYGATKSLLVTAGGGIFMLAGFLLLGIITGTFDIVTILQNGSMIALIKGHELFLPALVLIIIGAAAKSAQGPFYIWLPNAMEAPTPVSAFLHSATMVKAGIYLVARIHPIFSGTEAWFVLVGGLGIITMLAAGFLAFRQTDIKGILAYSTISQLAYMMAMYGYTSYQYPGIGVTAATFHLLNHATFKACLFLVAGIVAHETATRDITKMGGLRKELPATFIIGAIAALSMAGVPPLNGFLSKEMFYESSLEMGHILGGPFEYLIPAAAVLGGAFTFAYSIRFIDGIFLGKRRSEHLPKHMHEPTPVMLFPPALLAALVILIGIFPSAAVHYIIEPAASGILLEDVQLHVSLWHGFTAALLMTIITFIAGAALYARYGAIAAWQDRVSARYPAWSFNSLYDRIVNGASGKSTAFAKVMQPGPLSPYLIAMLLIFLLLSAVPVIMIAGTLIPTELNLEVPMYEAVLLGLIILASLGTAVLRKYLHAIIAVSAVGYLVSLVFIYLQAPDLAITQLLVETLATIIFLLVIIKVPQTFREKITRSVLARDLLISSAVSITVLILLLNASQGIVSPFESLSYYFIENSVPLAGGHNMVNVILVDFRGYDTLGEIVVLCLAGLGVYNLLKSRSDSK